MKRRVSEKVLNRIGRALPLDPEGEVAASAWDVGLGMYRKATILRAKWRRELGSGGTVCLECATFMGMDRC